MSLQEVKTLLRMLSNTVYAPLYENENLSHNKYRDKEDVLVINLNIENHYHGSIDNLTINE